MKSERGDGTVIDHTWTEQNLASHYTRVFERTAVDVTIQPLVCDGGSITTSCYGEDEKATVILKSHKISFFVTKTFTFKNIIVDGSELTPTSTCYDENKSSATRCCVDNSETYPTQSTVILSDGSSNDAQCQPPTTLDELNPLHVPWEEYSSTDDIWKKGPFALFVINFLRDYPQYIPSLTIEGCIFKNFWYHRYAYSFIYLDQRGAKLSITNSEFYRFYFPMGLITNIQKLAQRNSFFKDNLVSTAFGDCTTYNPSLSDCHDLVIQDSIFEDSFFGDYALAASEPEWFLNEGFILSLLEFAGPILIQGNTFK